MAIESGWRGSGGSSLKSAVVMETSGAASDRSQCEKKSGFRETVLPLCSNATAFDRGQD